MNRILEPEVMGDVDQARVYAEADFTEENQSFVSNFLEFYPDLAKGHILDLGCGPADIPIRLLRRHLGLWLTGVDASQPMIQLAERAVKEARLDHRITLLCQRFQSLVLASPADAVISNSLVHHVPNPLQFWHAVKKFAKPGSPILVMDLLRPESTDEAQIIVDKYAATEPEQLRKDFYNSLLSAFTEDEVASHLTELNLSRLIIETQDERHWIVYGRV